MSIMLEAEKLKKELPGMDCGSCGAPTCAAFAQDVVRGMFSLSDCVVFMRRELDKLQKSDDGDKQ